MRVFIWGFVGLMIAAIASTLRPRPSEWDVPLVSLAGIIGGITGGRIARSAGIGPALWFGMDAVAALLGAVVLVGLYELAASRVRARA